MIRHLHIYLVIIIRYCTFQLNAIRKHIFRFLTLPRISTVYYLQTRATPEHTRHIPHRRGIEIRNIEFFQTRAIFEHPAHIRHRRGVEVGNVEFFQTRTTSEHITHIFHRRGIEIFKTFDRCERYKIIKPESRDCREEILE